MTDLAFQAPPRGDRAAGQLARDLAIAPGGKLDPDELMGRRGDRALHRNDFARSASHGSVPGSPQSFSGLREPLLKAAKELSVVLVAGGRDAVQFLALVFADREEAEIGHPAKGFRSLVQHRQGAEAHLCLEAFEGAVVAHISLPDFSLAPRLVAPPRRRYRAKMDYSPMRRLGIAGTRQ